MGFFLCQTWEVAEGLSVTFIYSCYTQCGLRFHAGPVLYFVCYIALSVTFVYSCFAQCALRIHTGPVLYFVCYIALTVTLIYSCFTQCGLRIHGSMLVQCWTLSATLHCQWHSSTLVLCSVGPMLNFVCYIALSVTFVYSRFMQCRPNAELCLLHCTVSDIQLL